jgi:glucokinase
VKAVGVDIGGTKISAGLVLEGRLASFTEQPLRRDTYEGLVDAVRQLVLRTAAAAGDPAPSRLGAAVAGWLSADRSTVLAAANLGWAGRRMGEDLTVATGLDTVLVNDADAAAWGEYLAGPPAGDGAWVMLTLGTDVGGGVIVGGRLLTGSTGVAGELGHLLVDPDGPVCVCGARGCLATYASGTAMLRRARTLLDSPQAAGSVLADLCQGDPDALDGRHLAAAAGADDPLALRVVEEAATAIAAASAQISRVIDHGHLVLGGGAGAIGAPLRIAVQDAIERTPPIGPVRPRPIVALARLGNAAGVVGAAALAAAGDPDRSLVPEAPHV